MDISLAGYLFSAMTAPSVAAAVASLTCIICFGLLAERSRLLKRLEKREDTLDSVLEAYMRGMLSTSDALTRIRDVIAEIKGRI